MIAGNYIGVNPAGTAAIPNGRMGIFVDGASGDTIGLATAGGGNVISGNVSYGIQVGGITPSNNLIQNNLIGTDSTGTGSISNGNDGIYLNTTTGNVIGGTTPAARNIISGNTRAPNTSDGVWISGGSSNTIVGNYIGIDSTGSAILGNENDGINIASSTNNTIGGTVAGAGNVISGQRQLRCGNRWPLRLRQPGPGQLHRHQRRRQCKPEQWK